MSSNKYVLITGSDGLVGSESVRHFSKLGFEIIGIDNNSRKKFFGEDASVLANRHKLKKHVPEYSHFNIDITGEQVESIFKEYRDDIKLIIHTAAQPSHDWAATNPYLDFNVNAFGTLNLLENTRKYCKDAVFIFTSTNKVYGDNPNKIDFIEEEKRYSPKPGSKYLAGINEKFSIDNTMHSLFGASKLSADIITQEYGKYFGMKTVAFRGGCLTGGSHTGTMLHGFLSYLVKCTVSGKEYNIFGYKGKQVRDNLHSSDLVKCFDEFYKNPKAGEVYNIGGGNYSNCSMLEAIGIAEEVSSKKLNFKYIDEPRKGDHKWYVSDISKFENDYPNWKMSFNIENIILDIYENI